MRRRWWLVAAFAVVLVVAGGWADQDGGRVLGQPRPLPTSATQDDDYFSESPDERIDGVERRYGTRLADLEDEVDDLRGDLRRLSTRVARLD